MFWLQSYQLSLDFTRKEETLELLGDCTQEFMSL